MYLLDDWGENSTSLSVGLRLALKAGLAALEWVQYWQCSLSNVGNRLTFIPASRPELPRNSMVWSDCGNIICYSIGAYTVGTCSPRVRHVHPVRRSLKLPNASGRSCATPLLPGHPSGLCFYLARLWNRSVFRVYVQLGITVSGAG